MPPSAVRTSAPSTTAARQLPSVPPWPHQTTEPSGQRGRRRQGIRSRVERELCCAAPPGDVEEVSRLAAVSVSRVSSKDFFLGCPLLCRVSRACLFYLS